MDLIKENIEYEQLLGEKIIDNVTNDEFVIPDTHPDVNEILLVDTKGKIKKCEVMAEKIYIEGELNHNVMYTSKDVEEEREVYCVNYTSKFNSVLEVKDSSHEIECESECYVDHMNCNIINERKIRVGGIIKLKCETYQKCDAKIVKDVDNEKDIQFAKKPAEVDKIANIVNKDLLGDCNINVNGDLPEISEILKCDVVFKKRDVRLLEDSVKFFAKVGIKVLYKAKESKEICCVEDEVILEEECEAYGVNSSMENYSKFFVENTEYSVRDNEIGEAKDIKVELVVKAYCKVMNKVQIDIIEDAYSPSMVLNMEKKNYEMNVVHKQAHDEVVVKHEIELEDDAKIKDILFSKGEVLVTDKKVLEDKVVIEGLLKVCLVYNTDSKKQEIYATEEEIPFNCNLDIPGTKIHMQCIAKAVLDELECEVKRGEIKLKAIIDVYCRVCYNIHSEFLINLEKGEGIIPDKKASITIYVVQGGDTLWKIAKKYNTTIESLCKINDINDKDIKADMKLIIPGRALI